MKPGTFRMKSGRCFVGAAFAGFRVGKREVSMTEIRQYLLVLMARQSDPLLQSRFAHWLDKLRCIPNKEDLQYVVNDIKNRFGEEKKEEVKKSHAQEKREKKWNYSQLKPRIYGIYEVLDWLTKKSWFAKSGKPEPLYANEEL